MQLKKLKGSTTKLMHFVFETTLHSPSALLWKMHLFEPLTFFLFCHSSINHDFTRTINFICDYGKKQHTLVDMHQIVKHVTEINQKVLSECKEERSHTKLFPLVYDYCRNIHRTSILYNEFLRLLKDAYDSWLSLKLALVQIVARNRTENNYSYREMLEQLNDLEAAKGIRLCDNFITSFAFICIQMVAFHRHLTEKMLDIIVSKPMIALEKASRLTITCIFSILATYMFTDEQLQELKGACSYSMWLDLINGFVNKSDKRSFVLRSYGGELRIWEFLGSAVIVQELKMKMARFASFTRENEEMMMIVINKLEKMTDNISVTIEDMHRHAQLYSLNIREAELTLNQFIVDSNIRSPVTGVGFMPANEEQQYESPVSETITIMYQATSSLILTDLEWYICACEEAEEADGSSLLSCHSNIHDNSSRIIKLICYPLSIVKGGNSLDDIHKVIACVHAINQEGFMVLSELKEEWRQHPQLFHLVYDYHKLCLQTYQLYCDFVRLLKAKCENSWLSVILTMKEYVVNCRQDDDLRNYKEEMILRLNDDGRFTFSDDFKKSLAYICKQTIGFTRQFDEEISELKLVKVLAKVSSGLITGVLSVMVAYMVDSSTLRWMEESTLSCLWLHLIRTFSWKCASPFWMGERLVIKEFFDIDYISKDVKYILASTNRNRKSLMVVIDDLQQKTDKLLVTIEDMSRHASKCSDDIIKAGKTLDLISDNPSLPIKRKYMPGTIKLG